MLSRILPWVLFIFLAIYWPSRSDASARPLDCKGAVSEAAILLASHVKMKNTETLISELINEPSARRILENFLGTLDPYKVFLYKEEVDKVLSPDNIKTVELYLETAEDCTIFESLFSQVGGALLRHAKTMRATFANKEQLFNEVQSLSAMDKEELGAFAKSFDDYPENEAALAQKAKLLLTAHYQSFIRHDFEPDEAFAIALHRLRIQRSDFEFEDPSTVYLEISESTLPVCSHRPKNFGLDRKLFKPRMTQRWARA